MVYLLIKLSISIDYIIKLGLLICRWGKLEFNNRTYCDKLQKDEPYNIGRYYHDLFDFAVVDSISYHFDSKHYIVYDNSPAQGLTIRLDHGRAYVPW